MREVWLYRHGETDSWKGGERTIEIGTHSHAVSVGNQAIKNDGLNLAVMGVSQAARARRTALGMTQSVPQPKKLIEYAFLNELPHEGLERYQLIRDLYEWKPPSFYLPEGKKILEQLTTLDDEIQACVTHGSVIASITVALVDQGVIRPKLLVTPPLTAMRVQI